MDGEVNTEFATVHQAPQLALKTARLGLRTRGRVPLCAIPDGECHLMARKPVNPETVCPPVSPTYSHATIAEGKRLLFIAGQVATDVEGRTVGDDIVAQTRQVYANLRLILQSVGGDLDDILSTDVFMVNIERPASYPAW